MPRRIEAFLAGVNVNVMAYGQTGSGKTYTMFGPPGLMAAAAAGAAAEADYGLFPRGLSEVFHTVSRLREGGTSVVLTASAVELSMQVSQQVTGKAPPQIVRRSAAPPNTQQVTLFTTPLSASCTRLVRARAVHAHLHPFLDHVD